GSAGQADATGELAVRADGEEVRLVPGVVVGPEETRIDAALGEPARLADLLGKGDRRPIDLAGRLDGVGSRDGTCLARAGVAVGAGRQAQERDELHETHRDTVSVR